MTAFTTVGVKHAIKSGIVPREEMSKLTSPASGQNILKSLRWPISTNQKQSLLAHSRKSEQDKSAREVLYLANSPLFEMYIFQR